MSNQTEFKHWHLKTDEDNIAWLHIDKADTATNVLSAEVLEELNSLLNEIKSQPTKGLVIISDKKNGFIAGADITEFTTLADEDAATAMIQRGQAVMDKIESLPFPTISVIHGFCMGGGLELALACRYRIADDGANTKLSLPEIQLGIHPGFGGSVRLPPLIGAPNAMDLMLSGRPVNARTAKRMGIIDHAVPTRHLHRAARQMLLNQPTPHKAKFLQQITNHSLVRPLLAPMLRKQVSKKAREEHYPAPYALIDLWLKYGSSRRKMMENEARSVAHLVRGHTAQNLIRVYFLQNQLKSIGKAKDFKPSHVHVVGGGVMGGDIAAWCALQGMQVTIQDRSHETLARVIQRAAKLYQRKLKKPLLVRAALDRLTPDKDGLGVPQADVVIEAIFEDIDAKQSLYKEIEPQLKEGAILCTNTSSIPLETLSEALKNPERLVGLHFFNPVAQMQLIEIVKGNNTSAEIVEQAATFARQIKRLPLPVISSPGFLVNRILMPYLLEAVTIESEGVAASTIDEAALSFGMPMGPIQLADTVGLDICQSVAEILAKQLGAGEVPERLIEMVSAGNLGQKSGRGFYKYEKGKPVKKSSTAKPSADIVDRLVLRYLNEAVACQRENVVDNANLLDAGMVFGTGFAPFNGGPMHYIKQQGIEKITNKLESFETRYGARFKPDEGWKTLNLEDA